jgi:hypothetical protein
MNLDAIKKKLESMQKQPSGGGSNNSKRSALSRKLVNKRSVLFLSNTTKSFHLRK